LKTAWKYFGTAAFVTAVLDLAAKALVEGSVSPYASVPVIGGFFAITNVRNPGAAFSLFSSSGQGKTVFFIAVSVVALGVILFLVRKAEKTARLEPAALGLVFGGAAGNLVDRIRYGEVVDFLDFYLGNHHWPAFNVADAAIVVGVILLMAIELFLKTGAGK